MPIRDAPRGQKQNAVNAAIEIKDSIITAAKIKQFVSVEITGTGAALTTPHGLGVIPSIVLAIPTNGLASATAITYGTHTSTNCVITATTGAKYKILAIA